MNDGGYAVNDGTRGNIAGHDRAGTDDATIADRYTTEHGDAGTKPNITPDFRWAQFVGLRADVGAEG